MPRIPTLLRFLAGRAPSGAYLRSLADGPPPAPPSALRVVVWNMHYGYGPCFDRGATHSRAEVEANLRGIAETLRPLNPDLVALQEVDLGGTRARGIDQLAWLQGALGLPYAAYTLTWNVPWVPSPGADPRVHWGHVRSGQATLSRFPLRDPRRIPLPQPPGNPAIYNRFYLHRAALQTTVDLGDRALRALNVHTEAFDRQNCSDHAAMLARIVLAGGRHLPRTLLMGDLNSVPPEASLRHNFPDEPETDMRSDTALSTLRRVPGLSELNPEGDGASESDWFTFPAWEPNRRLDYLFYGSAFTLEEGRVLRPEPPPSDHLPLFARLALA